MKEYLKSAEEILKELEVTEQGLNAEQADKRLEKYGKKQAGRGEERIAYFPIF